MMLTENRYVIFLSSDTIFVKDGWYERLRSSLVDQHREYVLIENHALFGFDKKAIPRIGWFDEDFKIGPHFDTDFMIRASEVGISFQVLPNQGYYSHGDTVEETKQRLDTEVQDRLPMSLGLNDDVFKNKWQTSWPGWVSDGRGGRLHPPTNIHQVSRNAPEIDAHPCYTKKIGESE